MKNEKPDCTRIFQSDNQPSQCPNAAGRQTPLRSAGDRVTAQQVRSHRITADFHTWTRQPDGEWVTEDGKWRAKKAGRKWQLWYRSSPDEKHDLWGHWERMPWGKEYVPWDTLRVAIVESEEHEFRGLA